MLSAKAAPAAKLSMSPRKTRASKTRQASRTRRRGPVPTVTPSRKNLVRTFTRGVSDGPLLHIQLGHAKMGDRASAEDRAQKLAITAVDSRGLSTIKIIADGKQIAAFWAKGKTKFTKRLPLPQTAENLKYIRVETHSLDARRAYSNPIYLP